MLHSSHDSPRLTHSKTPQLCLRSYKDDGSVRIYSGEKPGLDVVCMAGVPLCTLTLQQSGNAVRPNLQPGTYTIERLSKNLWVRVFINGYVLTPPLLAEQDCQCLIRVHVRDILSINGVNYHVCSKIPDCLATRPTTKDMEISPAEINQWMSLSETHFQRIKNTRLMQFAPTFGLPQQFLFGSRVKDLILSKFPKFRLLDIEPQHTLAIFRNFEGDLEINAVCVFQRIAAIIMLRHEITSLQGCLRVKPDWSVKSKYGYNCMVKEMLMMQMSCWRFDAPTWELSEIGPKFTHRLRRFPSEGQEYFGETTVHGWHSDVHGSKPKATHELLDEAIEHAFRGVVITARHPDGGFVVKCIDSGEETQANVWTLLPLQERKRNSTTALPTTSIVPTAKPFCVSIEPSQAILHLKIGIQPAKGTTPSHVVVSENYKANNSTAKASILSKGDVIVGVAGFVLRTPSIHDPHSGERNLDVLKQVFATRVLHQSTSPSRVELIVLRPSLCTDWKKSLCEAISHHEGFVACEKQRLKLEHFFQDMQVKLQVPLVPVGSGLQPFQVDSILDERQGEQGPEYLIKWQGYDDPNEQTWETHANLVEEGASDLIAAYVTAKGRTPMPVDSQPAISEQGSVGGHVDQYSNKITALRGVVKMIYTVLAKNAVCLLEDLTIVSCRQPCSSTKQENIVISLQNIAPGLKATMAPSSEERPTQHIWDLYKLCIGAINDSLVSNNVSTEHNLLKKTNGVSELHLGGSMQIKICSLPNIENAGVEHPFDLSEACISNYRVFLSIGTKACPFKKMRDNSTVPSDVAHALTQYLMQGTQETEDVVAALVESHTWVIVLLAYIAIAEFATGLHGPYCNSPHVRIIADQKLIREEPSNHSRAHPNSTGMLPPLIIEIKQNADRKILDCKSKYLSEYDKSAWRTMSVYATICQCGSGAISMLGGKVRQQMSHMDTALQGLLSLGCGVQHSTTILHPTNLHSTLQNMLNDLFTNCPATDLPQIQSIQSIQSDRLHKLSEFILKGRNLCLKSSDSGPAPEAYRHAQPPGAMLLSSGHSVHFGNKRYPETARWVVFIAYSIYDPHFQLNILQYITEIHENVILMSYWGTLEEKTFLRKYNLLMDPTKAGGLRGNGSVSGDFVNKKELLDELIRKGKALLRVWNSTGHRRSPPPTQKKTQTESKVPHGVTSLYRVFLQQVRLHYMVQVDPKVGKDFAAAPAVGSSSEQVFRKQQAQSMMNSLSFLDSGVKILVHMQDRAKIEEAWRCIDVLETVLTDVVTCAMRPRKNAHEVEDCDLVDYLAEAFTYVHVAGLSHPSMYGPAGIQVTEGFKNWHKTLSLKLQRYVDCVLSDHFSEFTNNIHGVSLSQKEPRNNIYNKRRSANRNSQQQKGDGRPPDGNYHKDLSWHKPMANRVTENLPTSLSAAQVRIVRYELFDRPDHTTVRVEAFKKKLTTKHLWCLRPGTWLNDEIVNFCMDLINARDKKFARRFARQIADDLAVTGTNTIIPRRRKVLCMESFFFSLLFTDCGDRVRSWANAAGVQDIFTLQTMIVPINTTNTHWQFIQIDFREKQILYRDSLSHQGQDPSERFSNSYTTLVRAYLEETHITNHGEQLPSEWAEIHAKSPEQRDGNSCGVFVCMSAILLSDPCVSKVNGKVGLPLSYTQQDMPRLRQQLLLYILRKRLP